MTALVKRYNFLICFSYVPRRLLQLLLVSVRVVLEPKSFGRDVVFNLSAVLFSQLGLYFMFKCSGMLSCIDL
jgi:hypothetical protein